MWTKHRVFFRLALLSVFAAFIAAFAATQYDLVRASVRLICIHCIGLGG